MKLINTLQQIKKILHINPALCFILCCLMPGINKWINLLTTVHV